MKETMQVVGFRRYGPPDVLEELEVAKSDVVQYAVANQAQEPDCVSLIVSHLKK